MSVALDVSNQTAVVAKVDIGNRSTPYRELLTVPRRYQRSFGVAQEKVIYTW